MRRSQLVRRSLWHHRRTNLAVVAGVAVTVSVLAGSLLVGDSVRGSLRDLVERRSGSTDFMVVSDKFFPEDLSTRLADHPLADTGIRAAPLIALQGFGTHEASRRRASSVQVYAVDARFWGFHGLEPPEGNGTDSLWMSPALAGEFAAEPGDAVLVRVQRQTDIPLESLHANRDEVGRTMRFDLAGVLPADRLGEFSLRPQQGTVRAVFVPLRRLQEDLQLDGRVNTVLVAAGQPDESLQERLEGALRSTITLEDLGLRIRPIGSRVLSLESDALLLSDALVEAAENAAAAAGAGITRQYAYLANTIRAGSNEIPYSLVLATDAVPATSEGDSARPPLWLNRWAGGELRPRPGQAISLEYYVWDESGQLRTGKAEFDYAGVTDSIGLALDPDMAPQYPGITDADTVGEWNPPFPIDLKRVRPRDEEYWTLYRATPKAVIPLGAGQRLWQSRFGRLTSVRIAQPAPLVAGQAVESFSESLRVSLDPLASGFSLYPVRAQGDRASQGAVDFGEYFFYFSFFIVVSAVLLTGLFFRLGVEQRIREIGLLKAVGFRGGELRRLFQWEGLLVASVGSLLGVIGAVGYGALMMYGLRTWWFEAVGTTLLELHVRPLTILIGVAGGVAAALLSIVFALRGLRPVSARNLLAGSMSRQGGEGTTPRRRVVLAWASAGLALLPPSLAMAGLLHEVAGFFGSGIFAMVALLSFEGHWLTGRKRRVLTGHGLAGLSRLGLRNASWRPGRSLLGISLVASATFVIVAVDAFRHDSAAPDLSPRSGTGGYTLLAESVLPIPYDLGSEAARRELSFTDSQLELLAGMDATGFRLRPGDDTSCLNLYQPQNPKVLGLPESFLRQGRFAFRDSLARTPEQKVNPWLLLQDQFEDGAVPAAVDANSMTYVLHRKLGDDFVLRRHSGEEIRLRLVATLDDSIFQGELLIAEKYFLRLFPQRQGFRFFLIEAPPSLAASASGVLEDALSEFGYDVEATGDRLATFHRVENTYLSTFQALGGLGLLLGTLGLAAVLLRNVFERRRELAQLRAMGYQPRDIAVAILAENALLLVSGLGIGVGSALLAIAPALWARGGEVSPLSLAVLMLLVLAAGLSSSLLAIASVVRTPLLPALRTE